MKSMTGFGRAEGRIDKAGRVSVEVKTVNHRYNEVSVRLPGRYALWELDVVQCLKKRFSRGKVDCFVREEAPDVGLSLDEKKIGEIVKVLERIKNRFKIKDEVSLSNILLFKDLISGRRMDNPNPKLRARLLNLVVGASELTERMRGREGANLSVWFKKKLRMVKGLVDVMQGYSKKSVSSYKGRLRKKMVSLEENAKLDASRLALEVSLFAERVDVTEEIVRLKSHIAEFEKAVSGGVSVGRTLDFLCQEMLREVNTIGSKGQDVNMSKSVIRLKDEVEKIREQAQNVE